MSDNSVVVVDGNNPLTNMRRAFTILQHAYYEYQKPLSTVENKIKCLQMCGEAESYIRNAKNQLTSEIG